MPSAQRPARSSAQPPRAPRGHADRGKAEAPRPHGTYGSPAPPSPGEQQQQGRETRTRTASSTAVTARASPRRAEQRALPTAAPAGPQALKRPSVPAARPAGAQSHPRAGLRSAERPFRLTFQKPLVPGALRRRSPLRHGSTLLAPGGSGPAQASPPTREREEEGGPGPLLLAPPGRALASPRMRSPGSAERGATRFCAARGGSACGVGAEREIRECRLLGRAPPLPIYVRQRGGCSEEKSRVFSVCFRGFIPPGALLQGLSERKLSGESTAACV